MEIRDIAIDDVNIPDVQVYQPPEWTINPSSIFVAPPITQQVGVPVVDMPGCVEAHEQNTNKERSGILSEDDPKGVKVFCDAGVPSFNPIDYNKDELKFEYEQQIPPVRPPEQPEIEAPKTKVPKRFKQECPTEAQKLKEPIGTFTENGTKKITSYKLIGKECIPVKEDVKIPDQIVQAIPSAGAITTTGSIAVVATTSALLAKPLADLVLKAVKPTVKKVIKKIAAIRGKKTPVESARDRREAQRVRSHAIRKLKGKE